MNYVVLGHADMRNLSKAVAASQRVRRSPTLVNEAIASAKVSAVALVALLASTTGCQTELTKGKLYLRDGVADEALVELEKARAKKPDDPEVHFLIGTAHARRGDYEAMNGAFERSLALGDDHYVGIDRVRREHFVTAYNRGVTLLESSPPDFAEATRSFSAATVIDPAQTAGWRNLGYTYYRLDSLAAATAAYEGAARADSTDPVSWYDLGTAQLANSQHAAAISSLERLMGMDPQHWDGLRSLAHAFEGAGDTERAIGAYERLLAALPEDQTAHYNLGNLYWQGESYEQAIVAYEAAVELDPHDDDALHNLALSYIVTENADKALPLLQRLVQRTPDDPMLWRELGRLHLLRGDYAESERAFAREDALSAE